MVVVVEPLLLCSPVESVGPVGQQVLQVFPIHTLAPRLPGCGIGPSCAADPVAKIIEILVGHPDGKRLEGHVHGGLRSSSRRAQNDTPELSPYRWSRRECVLQRQSGVGACAVPPIAARRSAADALTKCGRLLLSRPARISRKLPHSRTHLEDVRSARHFLALCVGSNRSPAQETDAASETDRVVGGLRAQGSAGRLASVGPEVDAGLHRMGIDRGQLVGAQLQPSHGTDVVVELLDAAGPDQS